MDTRERHACTQTRAPAEAAMSTALCAQDIGLWDIYTSCPVSPKS